MRRVLAGVLGLTALLSAQAFAHHSAVMFDDQKEVTLTGTVVRFEYTNPHSWLIVDVKNDDGSVTQWGFEAEGPSTLMRAGIRKSDFTAGTQITITGNPMRNGLPAAAWTKATRGDGKQFDPRAGFAIK